MYEKQRGGSGQKETKPRHQWIGNPRNHARKKVGRQEAIQPENAKVAYFYTVWNGGGTACYGDRAHPQLALAMEPTRSHFEPIKQRGRWSIERK